MTVALTQDEIVTRVLGGAQVEEGNLAQQVLTLRRVWADAASCIATLPRYGDRFVAPVLQPALTTRVQGVVRLATGDEMRLGQRVSLVYCRALPDDTTLE